MGQCSSKFWRCQLFWVRLRGHQSKCVDTDPPCANHVVVDDHLQHVQAALANSQVDRRPTAVLECVAAKHTNLLCLSRPLERGVHLDIKERSHGVWTARGERREEVLTARFVAELSMLEIHQPDLFEWFPGGGHQNRLVWQKRGQVWSKADRYGQSLANLGASGLNLTVCSTKLVEVGSPRPEITPPSASGRYYAREWFEQCPNLSGGPSGEEESGKHASTVCSQRTPHAAKACFQERAALKFVCASQRHTSWVDTQRSALWEISSFSMAGSPCDVAIIDGVHPVDSWRTLGSPLASSHLVVVLCPEGVLDFTRGRERVRQGGKRRQVPAYTKAER